MVAAVVVRMVAMATTIMVETRFLSLCNRLLVFTLFFTLECIHDSFFIFPFRGQFLSFPMITFFFLFYSVGVIGFIWYGFDVLPVLHFTRVRIHDSRPLGQGHFPSYSRVR